MFSDVVVLFDGLRGTMLSEAIKKGEDKFYE